MNSSDRFSLKYNSTHTTFIRSMCLSFAIAVICLCASQTATAQNSYSDMWLAEAPSSITTSTTTTDESVLPLVDEISSQYATLAACGITEDDYTSYNVYQSETTIQSPSGAAAVASGEIGSWSRADVSLSLNLSSPDEGDYMVQTTHSQFDYDHMQTVQYGPSMWPTGPTPYGGAGSFFTWVSTLFGSVKAFTQVYEYADQLPAGTEFRYFYTLVCQKPYCKAESVRSFPASQMPGHPPFVIIRGVRLTINLLFTKIHRCVGWRYTSYVREYCL